MLYRQLIGYLRPYLGLDGVVGVLGCRPRLDGVVRGLVRKPGLNGIAGVLGRRPDLDGTIRGLVCRPGLGGVFRQFVCIGLGLMG
jgi:hypothetical protein